MLVICSRRVKQSRVPAPTDSLRTAKMISPGTQNFL